MTLDHLKRALPKVKDLIIINRSFTYQGQRLVFAFIGKENENTTAWIVGESLEESDKLLTKKRQIMKTYRQSMNRLFEKNSSQLIGLRKVEIQGCELNVSSASGEGSHNQDAISLVQYMWMIYNGCDLGELEHVSTDKLYVMKYTFTEDTKLPKIKKDEPLQIKLTFDRSFEPVKLQKSISVKMGEQGGKKYRFTDKETGEEQIIYIDRLIHFDIWEDAKTKFDDPRYREQASQEQIEEMKQSYLEQLPDICPQGMDLAVLEYETEREIILDIYTKDFLKKEVECKSTAMVMLIKPDSEPLKGHNVRGCILGTVEKDFDGEMKLEIFKYQKEIPEKVIEI